MLEVRAIVLAGGYATRLWPLTILRPKPLLPLGGDLIIDRIVDNICRSGEVEEIIVSINKFFLPYFQKWLKERKKSPVPIEISVERTMREEEKLGTIRAMEQLFKSYGEEEYLIIAGDNVFSYEIKDVINFYREKNAPVLVAYDLGSLDLVSRYGEISIDERNRIVSFREKPKDPKSTLIATACYIFPPEVIEMVERYLKEGNSGDSPGYFIQWLYPKVPIYAYVFKGYWFDVGSPDTYLEANEFLMRESRISEKAKISEDSEILDPVVIEEGATISSSRIGPHVYIGKKSKIEDSIISKSIILNNSKVVRSRLINSILSDNSHVEGIEIEKSVIGDYTKIRSTKNNRKDEVS